MQQGPLKFARESLCGVDGNGGHAEADLYPIQKRTIQARHGAGDRSRSRHARAQKLNPQDIVAPVGANDGHNIQVLACLSPERLDGIGATAVGLKVDDFPIGTGNSGSRRRAGSLANCATGQHQMTETGRAPRISNVPGFQACYVIYAPDGTVTAVSIFENYAAAQESNKRALA